MMNRTQETSRRPPMNWLDRKGGGAHRPRSENKYQQKNHCGEVLNFSFMKIIRRFLLFARLSYYFTPYNRLTDYSLQVHKLTKSSTLLSFWPAGFILPANHWKLPDIFFQYGPFGRGVSGDHPTPARIHWEKHPTTWKCCPKWRFVVKSQFDYQWLRVSMQWVGRSLRLNLHMRPTVLAKIWRPVGCSKSVF